MSPWRIGIASIVAIAVLGCSNAWWSVPIQVATGGPAEAVFEGVLDARATIAPLSDRRLAALRPRYPSVPNVACPPRGAWLTARQARAGTPATSGEAWSFDACASVLEAVTWSGGCGGPEVDEDLPARISTFTDGDGSIVVVILPLGDGGLARFEGRVPGRAALQGEMTAIGLWTLQWCQVQERRTPLGAGTVRLSWHGEDPREWLVPP